MKKTGKKFEKVADIMARLRSVDGCPWDRKQTPRSILPNMYEEADEVAHAIKKNDPENLKEELGDLLLQVLFQAQMAKEKELFDISDVLDTLSRKLVRRHPHVFGKKKAKNAEEALASWRRAKAREKK